MSLSGAGAADGGGGGGDGGAQGRGGGVLHVLTPGHGGNARVSWPQPRPQHQRLKLAGAEVEHFIIRYIIDDRRWVQGPVVQVSSPVPLQKEIS